MTYSKALLGTDKKKTKLTWFEYIFTHLIPTWFQSFNDNFVMWRDLVTGDYQKYVLLRDDDPFQECYDWFWCSINLDETYEKQFLEYLMQMVDDIETGKQKVYPMDEVFDRVRDFMKDLNKEELDDD